jgi:hypothetical protein
MRQLTDESATYIHRWRDLTDEYKMLVKVKPDVLYIHQCQVQTDEYIPR